MQPDDNLKLNLSPVLMRSASDQCGRYGHLGLLASIRSRKQSSLDYSISLYVD